MKKKMTHKEFMKKWDRDWSAFRDLWINRDNPIPECPSDASCSLLNTYLDKPLTFKERLSNWWNTYKKYFCWHDYSLTYKGIITYKICTKCNNHKVIKNGNS